MHGEHRGKQGDTREDGEDAQDKGLVDALGGLRRALSLAGEALEADPATLRLTDFPERRDPWEALLEDTLGDALNGAGLDSLLRLYSRVSRALAPLAAVEEQLRGDPRAYTLRAPEIGPVESPRF